MRLEQGRSCCLVFYTFSVSTRVTHTSHTKILTNTIYYYLLQLPPVSRFFHSCPFLYTSFPTSFSPTVSILLAFPFLSPRPRTSSSSSSLFSPSRLRFSPVRELPFPGAMFRFTLGGTENPKALPTFVKSSALTSNIFFNEYDAYACRYERNPSFADW